MNTKTNEKSEKIQSIANAIHVIKESPPDVALEFNRVLNLALEKGASDIHYDPLDDRLLVRFRIDGLLFDMIQYPQTCCNKLVAQIKVAADLDIAEKRMPQDGRLETETNGRKVSLRISTLPIIYGERVVIRILESSKQLIDIKDLGLFPAEFSIFNSMIKKPNGMLLVCGPTGSGKTTTLYSALNAINSRNKNIITIEDPVEYQIEGINQSQVNEPAGATFAKILRSVLRQDPDVILIGEIRDPDTASISVKAALTGHSVFSTLHSNRATAAVSRLYDLGVERSLIAASMNLSLAQILVRKICPNCKTKTEFDIEAIEGLDTGGTMKKGQLPSFSFGAGCDSCQNTGYKGRAALFELFEVTKEMEALIYTGASVEELESAAKKRGMRTLKENGFLLVNQGITTAEEVARCTSL